MKKTLKYPENLDLESLYLTNGYSPTVRKNMIIRTLKIVSRLIPTNYNQYQFKKDYYVFLNSKFKRGILYNYYTDFHNELINCEKPVIEMSSSYKVGEETKFYRLTEQYRNSKIKIFEYKEKKDKKDNGDFISNQFFKHKLSFNIKVNQYLFNFYKEVDNRLKTDTQRILIKNYIGRNLNIIKEISNKEIYFGRSNSNKRFYSSITSLNRIIRPFLLINNEEIISIDIKSAQPYILASIIKKTFYLKENTKTYSYNNINNKISGALLFTRFYRWNDKELEKFRNIKFEDDFYSLVLKGELGRDPTKIERERLKSKTMLFLFFNNQKARKENELSFLVNQFPEVNRFIVRALDSLGERKFSFILQRAESLLVLDICAKEFNDTFPDEPFYTIHDAILSTSKNSDFIYKLMEKRLSEHTGIKPGLKLEHPNMSVIPSEFDIHRITEKIIKRSREIKNVYNAVEVIGSNLTSFEDFIRTTKKSKS